MKTKEIPLPLRKMMLTGVLVCFFQWMHASVFINESGLPKYALLLLQEDDEFNEAAILVEDTNTIPVPVEDEENQPEETILTTEDQFFAESKTDSISQHALTSGNSAGQKAIPFYKMWWFSLLVLLVLSFPILRRYHLKNNQLLNLSVDDCKQKITGLEGQLEEKEAYYRKLQEEQSEHSEAEKELRFQSDGIAKFSDLIAQNKSNTALFGQKIISELVEYTGANSGAIYLIKEEQGEEPRLEYFGGFAHDINQIKTSFKIGEGYIGTCYKENATIELNETSQTFLKVYSGLGQTNPPCLVFVPLKQDDNNMGVIEIASFKKIDSYKIKFLEKLSENIASSLAISQANEKMQILLDQSKVQARELQTREEELRQNLEEMHATQEDLNRQMETNKIMQQSLLKEKALLDSLMNSLPDYIYFKDLDSKFIRISKSMLPIFPVKNIDEMVGKSDFDFINKETAQVYYNEEQEIIKSGKGFVDKLIHEVFENGHEQWSSITKMPLIDESGRCIGTYGITKDINDIKKLELDAREKAEMLLAHEEELRQNLEEMHTTQEDLERQIAENEKIQNELKQNYEELDMLKRKEDERAKHIIKETEDNRTLLINILDQIPGKIFVKDHEHKLVLLNSEVAKVYNTTVEKLIGTSDFDNHPHELASEYYKKEEEIMKKGAEVYVQKEELTGELRYLKTTKMPFRIPHTNKIGLLGIQNDITESIKMEQEIQKLQQDLKKLKK
ncbi:MAG: PAS domain-containing protein [Bacteroidales bacterium]